MYEGASVASQLDPLGAEDPLQDVDHGREDEPLPEVGGMQDQQDVPHHKQVVGPVEHLAGREGGTVSEGGSFWPKNNGL